MSISVIIISSNIQGTVSNWEVSNSWVLWVYGRALLFTLFISKCTPSLFKSIYLNNFSYSNILLSPTHSHFHNTFPLFFFYHAFISLIALSSLSISLHSFLYWSLATTTLHSPFCIDLLLQCYDFFIFLKSNPVHSCSQ